MKQRQPAAALLASALAATVLLAACGQRDDSATVGQKVDQAIATTERKAEEAKTEIRQQTAEAKAATENAADRVSQKVENAAEKVERTVEDAAVTASVNAELAKDPALSALKIDVDTNGGRVLLSGTAPNAEARERATRLAAAVKGVNAVDNRLQIGG